MNEEIIFNLEKILLDCDKSIDFWTKQLEKEYRDDYKKDCLEMIELQNKQKENYKRLIELFHEKNLQKKELKDLNVIINVPERLINND